MELLTLYDPPLIEGSIAGRVLDEDPHQKLRIVLLHCIRSFSI